MNLRFSTVRALVCVERDKIKLNWMKPKRIFYEFTRRVINAIRNGLSFGLARAKKCDRIQYRRRDKPMQFDGPNDVRMRMDAFR